MVIILHRVTITNYLLLTDMKRLFLFLSSLFVGAMMLTQAQMQTVPASDAKCLVLYYTYSGVTETLAQAIADNCGGTLLEVVDHGNYPRPESQTTYTYANNERSQIDAGVWPEIHTSVENFDAWDAVIICTPLWNGKMANPMLTFLHHHASKLAGKQVALAVTSWSSGITNVVNDAHNQLPSSSFVGSPLHINYNNCANIPTKAKEWVETLQFEVDASSGARKMRVIVGEQTFNATLVDNATAGAFKELLPLTLDMTELNGNEKYNYLSTSLPTAASNPGTIHAGDIMLYGSSCVVLFYETFNTSYSYTRIGAIDDPTGLAAALGTGNVTVRFEMSLDVIRGDVNGDNEVNISDVSFLIDYLLGTVSPLFNVEAGDVNGDNEINIGDVSSIIDILLSV